MRKFKIDDEAVRLLRARCFSQLYVLAVAEGGSRLARQRVRHLFRDIIGDLSGDIFETVTYPTSRAGHAILGLRISRSLDWNVALRAFDFLRLGQDGLRQ
jgi:hypothetical protein